MSSQLLHAEGQRAACVLSEQNEVKIQLIHCAQKRLLSTSENCKGEREGDWHLPIPLFSAGILAVMLQEVVAVPVVGALVFFFHFIPGAKGRGDRGRGGNNSITLNLFCLILFI